MCTFFSYIANSCNTVHDNDIIEMENLSVPKRKEMDIEIDLNAVNNLLTSTTVNAVENNISIENSNEPNQSNVDNKNHDSSQILETYKNLESNNQSLNKILINIPPQVCIF